jgi:hypothetical protein
VRQTLDEGGDGDLDLHACQRRAEAVMQSVPEREMRLVVPPDVEAICFGVTKRVAMRRCQAQQNSVAGGNRGPYDRDLLGGEAADGCVVGGGGFVRKNGQQMFTNSGGTQDSNAP